MIKYETGVNDDVRYYDTCDRDPGEDVEVDCVLSGIANEAFSLLASLYQGIVILSRLSAMILNLLLLRVYYSFIDGPEVQYK